MNAMSRKRITATAAPTAMPAIAPVPSPDGFDDVWAWVAGETDASAASPDSVESEALPALLLDDVAEAVPEENALVGDENTDEADAAITLTDEAPLKLAVVNAAGRAVGTAVCERTPVTRAAMAL